MSDKHVDGWVAVFSTGTDYEADLVRDRLSDAGVDAVVLTHRDHAFNLNVGKMAVVRVLVAPEQVEAAREVLESPPVSDSELTEAALRANPILENPDSDQDDQASNQDD
jgi:glyoxylase-like metal-dependent hydrolase (beta-lactamase superfamily II)